MRTRVTGQFGTGFLDKIFVPYTGATSDVNLGANNLTVGTSAASKLLKVFTTDGDVTASIFTPSPGDGFGFVIGPYGMDVASVDANGDFVAWNGDAYFNYWSSGDVYIADGGGDIYLAQAGSSIYFPATTGEVIIDQSTTTATRNITFPDESGVLGIGANYIRKDGTVALTADWDIGDGRMIQTDKIRARDGAGLALYEDGGAGIFIKDGGNVGIGTVSPLSTLHINSGGFQHGNLIRHNVGYLYAGAAGTAKRFEIARIGYNKTSWRYTSSVIVELWNEYYDVGYKKYVVTASYYDDGSFFLEEAHGGSLNMSNARVTIGTEVLVSGSTYYLPVYVELDYYTGWTAIVTHLMIETTNDTPTDGQIRIFEIPTGSNISAFSETDIVEHKTAVKFNYNIEVDGDLNHDGANVGFYGTAPVAQGGALTTQLTTITHTAPGTPDYAIQDLTQTTPFGFATKDEGNSVLAVIANLQTRVAELEARLGSSTGVGLFT